MAGLTIPESRARKAGIWLAEGVAEIKLEVDDDPSGTFRRLERLEALAIGIERKLTLWHALNAAAISDKALKNIDYERLVERGQSQRARVEALRLQAARAALIL